jgi:hypothetical protein
MVAVINGVVIRACAGLVLEAAGIHSLAIPVAFGAVIGAAAFTLQERHTVARATPTALRLSIGPRSSSHHRRSGSLADTGARTKGTLAAWLSHERSGDEATLVSRTDEEGGICGFPPPAAAFANSRTSS